MQKISRAWPALPGILGGVILAAAGVSPDEAISNLGHWATLLHVARVAPFLLSAHADNYGYIIGVALIVFSISFFFFKTIKRKISNLLIKTSHQSVKETPISPIKIVRKSEPLRPLGKPENAVVDSAKLAAIDEIYTALNEAEKVYDYGCDVIAGSWQDQVVRIGPAAYVELLIEYRLKVSESIVAVADLCDKKFDRFPDIHSYRQNEFGFQDSVFRPLNVFIEKLKKLPDSCEPPLLDLLANDSAAFKKSIGAFGVWVRDSKERFRKMRGA